MTHLCSLWRSASASPRCVPWAIARGPPGGPRIQHSNPVSLRRLNILPLSTNQGAFGFSSRERFRIRFVPTTHLLKDVAPLGGCEADCRPFLGAGTLVGAQLIWTAVGPLGKGCDQVLD